MLPLRSVAECDELLCLTRLEQNRALNEHYQPIYLGMAQGHPFTQPHFHHLSDAFFVPCKFLSLSSWCDNSCLRENYLCWKRFLISPIGLNESAGVWWVEAATKILKGGLITLKRARRGISLMAGVSKERKREWCKLGRWWKAVPHLSSLRGHGIHSELKVRETIWLNIFRKQEMKLSFPF